jgi:hypothetical protein
MYEDTRDSSVATAAHYGLSVRVRDPILHGVKRLGHDADHSAPSSDDAKNDGDVSPQERDGFCWRCIPPNRTTECVDFVYRPVL